MTSTWRASMIRVLGAGEVDRMHLLIEDSEWDDLIEMADELETAGRVEDALFVLEETARRGFAPAHHNRARLLEGEGRLEEALRDYRSAEALGYEDSSLNAGLLLETLERYGEAEEQYRLHLAKDVGQRVNLGTLLLQLGRVPEARELLLAAAEEDPGVNWQLSDVYLAQGDVESARASLITAMGAGEPRAARNLATLVDPSDEQQVRRLYRTAIEADAIGAVADLIGYLSSRGHRGEALCLGAEATKGGDSFAPLVYARLLAEDPEMRAEARAVYRLAAEQGDDVSEEVSRLDDDPAPTDG